jgi:thioredoxin 1
MSKCFAVLLVVFCLTGITRSFAEENASELPQIPAKDQVTMLNIGVEMCLSCQRMMSIVKELQREYQGKAVIVYAELPKHRDLSARYKLHVVPTQIFYDKDGKERYRHEGYLSKKRCVGYLEKLGAK